MTMTEERQVTELRAAVEAEVKRRKERGDYMLAPCDNLDVEHRYGMRRTDCKACWTNDDARDYVTFEKWVLALLSAGDKAEAPCTGCEICVGEVDDCGCVIGHEHTCKPRKSAVALRATPLPEGIDRNGRPLPTGTTYR